MYRFEPVIRHAPIRDLLRRLVNPRKKKTTPKVSSIKVPKEYKQSSNCHYMSYFDSTYLYDKFQDQQRFERAAYTRDYEELAFEKHTGTTFESYYGITKSGAWYWLEEEAPEPLQWFRNMRDLHDPAFVDLKHKPLQKANRATEQAIDLQRNKVPQIALVARAHLPNKNDMHCAYLAGEKYERKMTPIVVDTGATISISPDITDFVSELDPVTDNKLNGLGHTIKIEGIGWVEWTVRDYYGKVTRIRTRAFYVPQGDIRLFSPQAYFKECRDKAKKDKIPDPTRCGLDAEWLTITTWDKSTMTFPFNVGNNLPYMLFDEDMLVAGTDQKFSMLMRTKVLNDEATSLQLEENHNLSTPQKELALVHQRYGHAGMGWIQDLMKPTKDIVGEPSLPPLIPTRDKRTKGVSHPKCAACFLAKQHRRGAGSATVRNKPELEMAIR